MRSRAHSSLAHDFTTQKPRKNGLWRDFATRNPERGRVRPKQTNAAPGQQVREGLARNAAARCGGLVGEVVFVFALAAEASAFAVVANS